MTREEKIEQLIEEKKAEKTDLSSLEIKLSALGEPKAYARQRFTFKGKHSYNPRGKHMLTLKKLFLSQLSEDQKELINLIIEKQNKSDKNYYVEVDAKFYIKTPKADSIEQTALKEIGLIRPTVSRGDVDNYAKLILDTLHDVIYEDDKHVIKLSSEKFYSLTPRTELSIKILYNKGVLE